MGSTCTTENCCGKDGTVFGEVQGDSGSVITNSMLNDGLRPSDLTESARRRVVQLGDSKGLNSETPDLIGRIVKVQALVRGYLLRRRVEAIRNELVNCTDYGEFDDSIQEPHLFKNERVKQVYDKLGPFAVPESAQDGEDLVTKGPFRLVSGAIYFG